jgi:L-ascorbate metabolism protein UlaG (beta-lactamase superfamily)
LTDKSVSVRSPPPRRRLRVLKYAAFAGAALIAILSASLWAFLALSPQFGAPQSESRKEAFSGTGHYAGGRFLNQVPTDMSMRLSRLMPMLRRYYLTSVPDKFPPRPLPLIHPDLSGRDSGRDSARARVFWFGHSTVLLEIAGRRILFDPMLGQVPAPLPFLSTHRFNPELPLTAEDLPRLDAVLISHDHYDHLDYATILKLKDKTDRFYAPLGVGAHLARWGVEGKKIRELDWGDSAGFPGLALFCEPARHFSGRGLRDNSSTLWASWVLKIGGKTIYFSGDSGYGPHFRELGRRFGPFDFAMVECGQYDEQWPMIHMRADQAVRAARELGAKLMMPIHWGAFALSLHAWNDPPISVTERARAAGQPVVIPRLGEAVDLDGGKLPDGEWWEEKD